MGQEILVNEQIDEGANFVRDFNECYPVAVACWVSPTESDNLFLYIASDEINDGNTGDAYGEVNRIQKEKKSSWLDPFQIKLVNSADPIARDAIEIRSRYPEINVATRYNSSSIGGISVDSVYIYPLVSVMKSMPQR